MKIRVVPLVTLAIGAFLGPGNPAAAVAVSFLAQDGADSPIETRDSASNVADPGNDQNTCCDCQPYYHGSYECCDPDCETYGRLDAFFGNCPWICRSDDGFDDFISPMTNPFLFEDPRTVTEIRPTVLHQALPYSVANGHINMLAMPIRVALNDRLSLIVPKNGYIMADAENGLIRDGWADTSIGFKYNLMKDHCRKRILSTGASFELPSGDREALQGNGDGVFNMFASYGAQYDCYHWISGSGFVLPTNTTDESQIWWWSNHVDRKIIENGCLSVYALGEVNWYHWMQSGEDGSLPGIEGGDLINLGSPGVAGNDIVTGAFGTKIKPYANAMEIGVAWETHMTERRDLLEDRLTVDWILRF